MESQAYDTIKLALEKLHKVRDAPTVGDGEQAIVIDVVATLRTLLAMYTEPVEPVIEKKPFRFTDITRNILGDK